MTSIDSFHREREYIFDRCWIYLAHEPEVENPGDYRRRIVAGRPLFSARGKDDQVRVFINIFSTAGHQGEPGNVGCGTAKAELINFTRTVAIELAKYGI